MTQVRVLEDTLQARHYPGGDRGSRGMRSYFANSRVYVFVKGESVLDNLLNRYKRPGTRYKSVVLAQHPELEGRIRWSQNAGCSCGCSPGFVIDKLLRDAKGNPADMYITITADPILAEQEVDMSYVEMALA